MLSNVTFASRSMDLLPELFTISELMKRPREVIVVFTHIAFVAGVALDVAMARRRVMIIWHLTPELSRAATWCSRSGRQRMRESYHDAAKRRRLERIVSWETSR